MRAEAASTEQQLSRRQAPKAVIANEQQLGAGTRSSKKQLSAGGKSRHPKQQLLASRGSEAQEERTGAHSAVFGWQQLRAAAVL